MLKQIVFFFVFLLSAGVFFYTVWKLVSLFKLTRPAYKIRYIFKRISHTLNVAFAQTKILRRPAVGTMHALVFWGFLVILFGSIEMIIDGLFGTERILSGLGKVYEIIIAAGDIFALIVLVAVIAFLVRRIFMKISRFSGIEMKQKSHLDAKFSLLFILFLMVTLLGMNTFYTGLSAHSENNMVGLFPVSSLLSPLIEDFPVKKLHMWYEISWWGHIIVIFFFANYLPYSKHFHVFMSIPNVFLTNLDPMGKLSSMESVTKEVKLMLTPEMDYSDVPDDEESVDRFGVLDIEDITWKNYLDSLSCTQCGRCTSVCPANITGKKLSPRKIIMNVRERMKEKGPQMVREGKDFSDKRSLINNFVSEEELWACTTCNACAMECPVNIDPPRLIIDMRRYLVMEKSKAPGEINSVFSNIENNGAPWQFSQDDRMEWAKDIDVPVMAGLFAKNKKPEYLFWVGSPGAFDDRYKNVIRAFVKILTHLGVSYAVLGTEESSSGDVARRAGNEMLFQMQAMMNIELMNKYEVKKIITCDPHVYNTFLNEYPDFGGNYQVIHHTQFLAEQFEAGNLKIESDIFVDNILTYHDPCYLGRINGEYAAPRKVLNFIPSEKKEMKRNKSKALCCGAGGGQMFKEAEKGDKEIFIERTEEAIATGADIITTACPYCMAMITDGIKYKDKVEEVKNYDIAEIVSLSLGI